jgi:hypothetical protein
MVIHFFNIIYDFSSWIKEGYNERRRKQTLSLLLIKEEEKQTLSLLLILFVIFVLYLCIDIRELNDIQNPPFLLGF